MIRRVKKLRYLVGVLKGDIHCLKMAINYDDPKAELIFRLEEMERFIEEQGK